MMIMQDATQASAKVQPYLFFDGRCEEALEFYKKAVGAEVETMMRFCDSPEPAKPGMCTPGSEHKIMHSCFRIGNTQVMASDGRALGKPVFQGFALSLLAADEADADRLFTALANGGQLQMPLAKTFFSPRFGMVADRFGVGWMVIALPRSRRIRHQPRVRRPTRAPVEVFHGSPPLEGVVGSERLQGDRSKDEFARRRHLSLWFAGPRRDTDVGQVHVSRDHPAGKAGVHQFVLG
jgi:PhnB protein